MPAVPLRLPATVNALSVDLEDWYHVCGVPATADPARWEAFPSRVAENTERLLALLRAGRARATFFVLGYVAEREPALVRALRREGHEVAVHGHFHRRLYEMSPDEFAADLRRALEAVAAAGGGPVAGYRAPEWSMRPDTLWALGLLRRHGILYDSSMVPTPGMGDPRFPSLPCRFQTAWGPVTEFPLTTASCLGQRLPYSGGLALRLVPVRVVASRLRRLNRAGWPGLVYVHPWEFDPAPPRLRLPWSRRFIHDFNLPATPRKLAGLLRRFRFAPVREVLGMEEGA
jgi:polysaccharide deacetylase family protein (PEP-CTERM system associated)